jgi:hypothetical protein
MFRLEKNMGNMAASKGVSSEISRNLSNPVSVSNALRICIIKTKIRILTLYYFSDFIQ